MEIFLKSRTAKSILIGLLAISLLGVVFLTIFVELHPLLTTDISISREVQEHSNPWILLFMRCVSFFGSPFVAIIMVLITSGIFFWTSCKREALFVLFTLGAGIVSAVIKIIVNRPRPTDTLVAVYQKLTDPSFPSGHVLFYVVFFGFLIVAMGVLKKFPFFVRVIVSSVSFGFIIFVSVSRLYLGAHWATDVIAGYCIGLILLFGLLYYYFKESKLV